MKPELGKLKLLILIMLFSGLVTGCTGSGSASSYNGKPGSSTVARKSATGSFGNKSVRAICNNPVSTVETSLSEKKKRSDIYLQLGMGYLQQGQYGTALSQLDKAIQLSPSSAQIHSAMALLNLRIGRADDARKSYQRALRSAPGDPEINNNYGHFLYQQGEYLEADKRFQCALANPLYSTPWRAYYNAGINALAANQLQQADIYLRTVRQLEPNLLETLYYLADLAHRRGSNLQAADYLERYRESARPTPESLWLGIKISRELNNQDMEASYTLSLKNLFPDSDQAQSLYAK